MEVRISELQNHEFKLWDRYVESRPEATFFHRAGWKRVIEASFGQRGHFLCAEAGSEIVGVLPLAFYRSRLFGNGLISNGCGMGGGTVANDDDISAALDARAIELMGELNAAFLEYRRPIRRHPSWMARDDLYSTFERAIKPDEAEDLLQIPRKQRAVLRKTFNSKLRDDLDETIDRFYFLYATSVRNLGTPVFSKSYFRNLVEEFGEDCDILTVSSAGKPLASVLSFYFRDRVMPYYAGAIPEARTVGANDFMYWRLMRRAAARGYRLFDFGRSKIGTGAYSFKKNWGFAPLPVVHEYRTADGGAPPAVNPNNPKYRLFIAMWKRLPLPIANAVGPRIIREIG